jgi:hypothetical protein
MADLSKIPAINKVIQEYFESNPSVKQIPAKDLMPYFVKAGIFPADRKGGLPIRDILRTLDRSNQLHKITYVYADRKASNTNWFFVSKSGVKPSSNNIPVTSSITRKLASPKLNRDEGYVIDLMDEILGHISIRQHTFDFLRGDAKDGGQGKKLPVDAYYPELNLVVEYREVQHEKPVGFFDKPDRLTVSGVHRGEQRRIYDERRRKVLPENGLLLLEIPHHVFDCDRQNRIIRNHTTDKDKLIKHIGKHHPHLLKK